MAETTGAADGLRVLGVGTGLPGALAGMILADNGAEVVKVEPPGGDPNREHPAFRMWNRGVRSLEVDLAGPVGRARVRDLVAGADVLLSTLKPGAMDRFGLAPEPLLEAHPALVVCHVTGFGRHGPNVDTPGYDAIVTARAGRMAEFKMMQAGRGPVFIAVPFASYGASQLALHGIFAALLDRERTGRGQLVETSLLRALTVFDIVNWLPGNPMIERIEDRPWLPYTVACTADGIWIQFAQLSPVQYRAFVRALGLDEIWQEPRFANAPYLADASDARDLRDILLARVREKPWAHWQTIFDADRHMAVEPFLRPAEAMDHPQLVHNGDVVRVDDPVLGATRQLGPLASFSATPSRIGRPGPAPVAEGDALWSRDTGSAVSVAGGDAPSGRRPLEGVVVLELATWIATPIAATLLADLGARVIKIEPLAGDPIRQVAGAHLKTVQGKESIALDLKREEAREIAHALVARADVLVHNYRPGVPERLGIDYDTLRRINPRLVHLYGASYGSTGPCAGKPAYHPTAGAICGAALTLAGSVVEQPTPGSLSTEDLRRISRYLELANESHPDPNAGLASATALLMALYARERTGLGQAVETRMICSNAYVLSGDFIEYDGRPPRPQADAELLGMGALYRLYPAADGWVFLAAARQREFERLCEAAGCASLAADPRFADATARRAHDAALAETLATLFRERVAQDWETDLGRAGVACVRADDGPFARVAQTEPWMREAGIWSEVRADAPSAIGPYARYGATVRLSRDEPRFSGPRNLGADTDAILAELGYDGARIEILRRDGVVGGSA